MAKERGIRAGRAYVELGMNNQVTRGLRAARRQLRAFGAGVKAIGIGVLVGSAAITAPILAAGRAFAATGDALEKMSRRTGIGVEALSELGFAAEQSGGGLEVLEKGVRTMQRTINDAERGLSTAVDAFDDLGLSSDRLRGLSPEAQFKTIAEAISRVEDPTKRAALAMQIFGRAGTQLLPLMEEGADGIEALQAQARAFGLTVSTESAKQAALLTDTLNILWRVVKRVWFEFGAALAPVLIETADIMARAGVTVLRWVEANKQLIANVAKVVGKILVVNTAGGVLAAVLLGAVLAASALLTPLGLAAAAVAGLGVALVLWTDAGGQALDWLGDRFRNLLGAVDRVAGGVRDALMAGDIGLAAEILWLTLKLIWARGMDELNAVLKLGFGAWLGSLAAVEHAMHGLEVAWIETTSFLSTTWTRFAAGFREIWEVATAFVAKRMLEIQGLFDDGLDVGAAKRAVDEQLQARLGEIESGAQGEIDAREAKRRRDRERAREQNQDALAEIGRRFGDSFSGRKSETQARLDEARAELAEALEAARRGREEIDGGDTPRRGIASLLDELDGIGETIARKLEVRGTFSAAAVQGLAASGAADRTAKATEQTAKNTKRLLDAARSGGLVFG
ncbi:MAG: hypothetical protein AMXMBFR77_26770 [Phycisphaerales bacterium]